MSVTKHIGKIHYRCNMCGTTDYSDKYEWIGEITKIKLNEITSLIKPLCKKSSVHDDNVINLLNYYELINELKTVQQ